MKEVEPPTYLKKGLQGQVTYDLSPIMETTRWDAGSIVGENRRKCDIFSDFGLLLRMYEQVKILGSFVVYSL